MNLMGKILTLLIFFMSICFLVVAVMVGAAHQNWQQAAADSKARADVAEAQLNEIRNQSGNKQKLLAAEKFSRAMQLAQLESQLKVAQEAFEEKEEILRKEIETSSQRLAALDQAEKRLAQQDAEVADLKSRNSKLIDEIAQKFAMVQNLTNEKFELTNQLSTLDELNKDLSENLAVKQRVMEANGLDDTALTDHIPPRLDALVLRINEAGNLVAISAGTDDGLRQGHVLDIYRGDRFVGKATVKRADHDVSVAETNKDFMQDRVREGDHVTSKF